MADETEHPRHPDSDQPASEQTGGEETGRADEAGAPPEDGGTDAAASPGSGDESAEGMLDPSEVDALLTEGESRGAAPESASPENSPSAENLLDQAEADLAAAMASDLDGDGPGNPNVSEAQPFQFEQFDHDDSATADEVSLEALQDVQLDLRIELGRTELLIEDVLRLKEGSVVPLDKLAGDPVDILVNGRLIARGEVLVLNDNFCVRVAEILTPEW